MKEDISSTSKATELKRLSGSRSSQRSTGEFDTDIGRRARAFIHAGLYLRSFESKTSKWGKVNRY